MAKGENKMLLPKQQADSNKRCCSSSDCLLMKVVCISVFAAAFALGVIGYCIFSVSAYPFHASCKVDWTFGRPCQEVQAALINQMNLWRTGDNCGTGQKCLYTYLSSDSTTLKGLHTTPINHHNWYRYAGYGVGMPFYKYVDNVEYTFTQGPDNTCFVNGKSSTQLWYAVLDYGTNYCNIKNLVDGANLGVNDSKFNESTRDAVCTQYSSANCEVY